MKNDGKTKNELIEELESVRTKVKKLEALREHYKHTQQDITERKRLQEELETYEKHYRGAFETSQDGLLHVHRFKGDILDANAYAQELLGYSKEEFLKNNLWGVGVFKDDKDFQEALSRLEKDGVIYYDNIPVKNKAGLVVNTEVILVDKVKFIQCNIRDNTERKRVEKSQQESEDRYRNLVELSPDPIFVHSEGKIVFVNSAALRLFGAKTPEEIIGKSALDFVHPDYREFALNRIQKIYSEGLPSTNEEEKFIRFDGTTIDVEVSSIPCIFSGRKAVQGVIRDITERKRAEQELRESNALIEAVVENVPLMIFLKEAKDLRFVVFNRAGEELLGYDRKELLGRNNLDLFPPEQAAHFMAKDREVLDGETGMLDIPEEPIMTAKKGQRLLHTRKICIKGADGVTKYLLGISDDITERKRVEETTQRLAAIVESSDDAIIGKTLDGTITSWNYGAEKIYGYSAVEIVGRSISLLIPPEQKDELTNLLKQIKQGLPTEHSDTIRVRKDGSRINVSITISPVHDGAGKIVGASMIARDITERKRTEEELRKSEERFKLIFEYAPDAFYLCDLKGTFIAGNKAAEKITGFEKEELIGGSFLKLNLLSLDQIPKAATLLAKNVIGKSTGPDEFILKRKNGDKVLVEISTHPIKFEKRTLILGIARDITERKRVEKQIALLAHTLKSVTECVSITDLNDVVLFVNNAFLKTYGYTENEILGKNINVVRSLNDPPEAMRGIHAATMVGGWSGELMNRTKDGREFPVSLSTSFVRDEHGQNIALVGVAIDITEHKLAEGELKKSEEKYRSIFENVQDVYYEASLDGTILEVSPSIEIISRGQYNPADLMGKSIYEFYPDAKGNDTFLAAMQKTSSVNDFEVQFKNRDGSFIPCSISAKIKFDAEGRPEKIIGSMRDITERKRVKEALEKTEEKFRELFENAPIGYHEIDELGNICAVNQTEAKMLGYSSEEMIGWPVWEFNSDSETSRKRVLDRLAGNIPPNKNSEQFLVRRDGTLFPALIDDVILHNEHGAITGIRTTVLDITKRKRAEEALRETTDYLESLLSFANAPIMVWDNNNKITRFNLAFERLTGYTMYDVIGKRPEILISPDKREAALSLLKRTSEGENLISVEIPVRCKDRSVRTVLWNTANIYTADSNSITATIALGQDITEHKLEEKAREHREAELQESQRIAHIGSWEWTISTGAINWSEGLNHILARDLGLPSPTFEDLSQFYTPESWQRLGIVIARAVETGAPYDLEVEMIRADGTTCWTTTRGEAVRGEDGTVVKLRGTVHDITESKRAKEALQESELRFRSLYENATIGLYRTTPDGNILLANPALVEMLGYASFEKLIERNLEKDGFEPSYQRKEFLEKIEREGEVNGYDSKWTRQDGKAIFVLESARAIRDSQGKTLYYDGTVEDVTNHKLLEDQMRQMQKLESLGTLAGGIAHDFNNILGIILAFITSIKRFKDDTKKLDNAIDTIVKAVDRGKTLVKQILTFARKSETEFAPVDVNDLVMEIMTMIHETFPKVLTYSQNFDKAIPWINADRSQLHQALLNLCVNARDAMSSGGVLTINTRMVSGISLRNQHPDAPASGYVCIEVGDTGEGMTDEIRQKIFEPFFTTKEKGKGTGLGLAVVFGVVKTHKGFVDVESGLRKGTIFRLYFPVPQTIMPSHEEIQDIARENPGGTETLLVVEDEETLMAFLQISLTSKGYTIISAVDGPEAVKNYRERYKEISIVFTDLGLPGMTGMEEINIIKRINPDVKIIVSTGFLDPAMKSELLKAGVKKFLLKPYNFEEILKLVREVLDEK